MTADEAFDEILRSAPKTTNFNFKVLIGVNSVFQMLSIRLKFVQGLLKGVLKTSKMAFKILWYKYC